MKNESKERAALRALVTVVTAPDAVVFGSDERLGWKPATREAIREAERVLANEDADGFPTVTLTLPLRSARGWRDRSERHAVKERTSFDEFDVLRALEALGAPARARVRAWLEARDAQGGVT